MRVFFVDPCSTGLDVMAATGWNPRSVFDSFTLEFQSLRRVTICLKEKGKQIIAIVAIVCF